MFDASGSFCTAPAAAAVEHLVHVQFYDSRVDFKNCVHATDSICDSCELSKVHYNVLFFDIEYSSYDLALRECVNLDCATS